MKWVKASDKMPAKNGRYVVKRLGEPMIAEARLFKNGVMAFVELGGMQWKGWKDFEWLDESVPTETDALGFVNEMCIESLSPETFEAWEKVKEELKGNRKLLREKEASK